MRANFFSIANFLFIFAFLAIVALFALNLTLINQPIENLHQAISLDFSNLLIYSLRSIWRMTIAITISTFFGLIYGMLAAKYKFLESSLLAILDILQSVPIIGFLSFTIAFFLSLSPQKIIGAELAVIFAFFTSQAWNIAFSVYQSFKSLPKDLEEVTRILDLIYLERFLKFELPFAMPGLLWNIMISMSGGWVYIVMSESISIGDIEYKLPGIGSYLAEALLQKNHVAIINSLVTICSVIFILNKMFFKPLIVWAEKFKTVDANDLSAKKSQILVVLRKSSIANYIGEFFCYKVKLCVKISYKMRNFFRVFGDRISKTPRVFPNLSKDSIKSSSYLRCFLISSVFLYLYILTFKKTNGFTINFNDFKYVCGSTFAVIIAEIIFIFLTIFVLVPLAIKGYCLVLIRQIYAFSGELQDIFILTCLTFSRVLVVSFLAVLIWTPIAIFIGFRPKLKLFLQPIIQILAALPMQLFFPLIIIFIDYFKLNQNIWLSLITMIAMQYYLLFNVIAGSSNFPGDLMEVVKCYDISPYQKWIKIIIPAILPYIITGCITATGSAWNASIIAEVVTWGDEKLIAKGIGSYIVQYSESNDQLRLSLGIISLVIFVTLINKFIWHPLYKYASKHLY